MVEDKRVHQYNDVPCRQNIVVIKNTPCNVASFTTDIHGNTNHHHQRINNNIFFYRNSKRE